MLIPLNDIIFIYEQILKQLNIDYVSVVIFSGIDIDSLCALKIITKFFKSQSVHYKIYPVNNYTDLQQRIEDSKQYESVKLFLFINCGSFSDLTEKWFLNQQQQIAKVFLFDMFKPVHHKNVQCPNIYVIDDQHSGLQNRITSQEMTKYQELNDFEFDEEMYEDDQNSQNSGMNNSPKRNAATMLSQKLKKHKMTLQKKINKYYSVTFFSLPTSYCLYRLIRQLNKANNYSLWYAIVGMTSMYLQNNMPKQILQTLTNFYRSDMVKFNPQNNQKRQKGQIFTKKGYQFPLMNHWSLYESMLNSPYLNIHLHLWNDKGLNKLHQILTKIGISLEQAKQQYKYMTKDIKDSLQQKIFMIAEAYNLTQITYESFMKQTDSSSAYMASDFYFLISAILEKPLHKSTIEELSQHRLQCFWSAYSVLDGSQQMIKQATQQFKQMSNIFMKQARDILQRDNILIINKVHFTNIRCDTKQKRLFQHPHTLLRLANMLMGIQKQRRSEMKKMSVPAIPYFVSLYNTETNLCLIVGASPQIKSTIGPVFNTVINKLNNISVKHDFFMANVAIVPKDNLIEFMKQVGNVRN